jgi:hypothetical protein
MHKSGASGGDAAVMRFGRITRAVRAFGGVSKAPSRHP